MPAKVDRLPREQAVVHAESAPVAVRRQRRRRLKRHALVCRELRDGGRVGDVEIERAEIDGASLAGNGVCGKRSHHVCANPVRRVVEVVARARAGPVRDRNHVGVRHVVVNAVRLDAGGLRCGDRSSHDAERHGFRNCAPGKDALAVRYAARAHVNRHHGAGGELQGAERSCR